MSFVARSWRARHGVAALSLGLLAAAPAAAQRPARATAEQAAQTEADARYIQPPAPIADMFKRDASFAVLDAPAPGNRYFLVPKATQLSSLPLMSRPTYRLAELEVRPATDRLWHLDTFGIFGLRIYDLTERRFRDVALPANTFVSDPMWSPDGKRVAFLAHLPNGTEVWMADAATGRAERVSGTRILATLGTSSHVDISPDVDLRPARMLQWTPDGTLLTLAVPANRGTEPAASRTPTGPTVRVSRPSATATRTFSNLLHDSHDAALFEYYTRSQLVELAPGKPAKMLGEPRMYESIALSADGKSILAKWVERPFSFITSWRGFPGRTAVLDRTGGIVATLEVRRLREGGGDGEGPRGGGGGGLRGLAWHPSTGALVYLKRQGTTDQVMQLAAPFDTARATVVATSEDPIGTVDFTADGTRLFGTVTKAGRRALASWERPRADSAARARHIVVGFSSADSLFSAPGELWTEHTTNGIDYAFVSSTGDPYLRGDGLARDYRPRPFVDRVSLADTTRARLFTGAETTWDRPLVALDADLTQMIVSREGKSLFPDSHLWSAGASALVNLTQNVNPFPELANVRRMDFTFKRQDGVEVQGNISLPVGYRDGDKVPAVFWTYPREFTTADGYTRAAFRARNHNAFTHLTWMRWSELWLTQGYALVYPDIPIIGENYNDTYLKSMVDGMYGAMRAVDKLGVVDMERIGHGGHSYGAFATANFLAHTPFFKAGIAGDGAYNRSLTPTGFQAESRSIWSAQSTYMDMSPFFVADQINAPILLYHGGDDNNTGTWLIQSERFMQALTALGKTSALYVYPYESHTPRALENNLDRWARWIDWFDRYVKGSSASPSASTSSGH